MDNEVDEGDEKSQSESLDDLGKKAIKLDVPFTVMQDLQDIFMLRRDHDGITCKGERLAGCI